MKIEWIHKSGGSEDITEAVGTVRWGGSVSQAARTAEITIANAPGDENIKKLNLNIGPGETVRIDENGKEIFLGEVQTAEKLSQHGEVTCSCTDLLGHLLRSYITCNFGNTTAEDITRKVCADFGIETGEIAASKVPIPKMIIEGDSIYDTVMKASRQTGELYICRMHGTKLSVEVKGTIVKNFVLAEGCNVTDAAYQETIENMVNIVKIYDDAGKQVGEVRRDEWVAAYGAYQQVYKKEEGANEITAAESMLAGIEKNVTVSGINGNLDCIAGNAVEVRDSSTGLSGIFWIESDTHTWENGIHTMSLELNFKNLMDEKDSGEAR